MIRRNSKAAIAESAFQVFSERGYAGGTTLEIAKRAGVAEGSVFRYYRSKKQLFLCVVRPVLQEFFASDGPAHLSIQQILQNDYESLQELLNVLFNEQQDLFEASPPLVKVLVQELASELEVRALFATVLGETVLPAFQTCIERLQQRGQIRPMPPERATRAILGVLGGCSLNRYFLPTRQSNSDRETMVDVLQRGLAPAA